MTARLDVPRYADLLRRTDAPPGSSWGLFGVDDELGTLNFLTPKHVIGAQRCVRHGRYFNLDYPLDAFDPPILAHRQQLVHRIFGSSPHHRDDAIDSFFLQSGSQIDGLRHFRHPVHGFYNGTRDEDIVPGNPRIGINRVAEHGVIGRGVLIDVERHLAKAGRTLDYATNAAIPVALVDEIAAAEGVEFQSGDVLMLRTGWLKYYFGLSDAERTEFPKRMCSPGLPQSHETLAWIWDHQFAVCASDNFGLECFPPVPDSPFPAEIAAVDDVHPRHTAMMHAHMIALLGLTIGEQWNLEALAADCAADGVWECMVAAKPLNLVGGVGSPVNGFALK